MEGTLVFDTPDKIKGYRILAMRSALKLEILGLKHSRVSIYALVKQEFGFKGSKQKVLEQLNKWIDENLLKDRLDKTCVDSSGM
jgi:hypothetical protein